MPDCVLSSQNRFYVETEAMYGQVPTIGSGDRIAAVRLRARQRLETPTRRDKTGGRTFTGFLPGRRRQTEFELLTYLVNNPSPATPPAIGSMVQASLGATPLIFAGGTAGSGSGVSQIVFSAAHGLAERQAFGLNGEIRFVTAVNSTTTVTVNAPFKTAPTAGTPLTAAVTYLPAEMPPSASIFDYWDPGLAVDRIVAGAAVDRFRVRINGDFHELEFSGPAQDVLDSVTFTPGEGGLGAFPGEPPVSGATQPPVAGHLGQAWLGSPASKFVTVTSALVEVRNDLDVRAREFGSKTPLCAAPGPRRVFADLELFERDDEATRGLYAAARQESAIQVMFQLGEATGQMMGVYLPQVTPQLPEFDDSERVLQWAFREASAAGSVNDEIAVAFG
ncbi:MAG: hypothetical protein GC160_19545 [Acidobacteria bacterium]|nr:hypothetical protein [Acidobacteriota bacterium]